MTDSPSRTSIVAHHSMRHEMGWVATTCGIASALCYMLANVCLRSLTDLDPIWVSAVKALPTVVVFAPAMCKRIVSGQLIFPSLSILGMTLLASLFGQLAGNVCFQWSLGVVGIALAVPITLGSIIVTGALLGRLLLGDRVTPQMALASLVLILAICVLSLGAGTANSSIQTAEAASRTSWLLVAAGVGAACICGLAYSVLGVVLRYASNRNTPLSSLLFTVGLVGVLVLGGLAISREGGASLWATSRPRLVPLLAAGLFNVLAFWALTKALQLASVLFVNALNASQTALAALAGVLLFQEPLTAPMVIGVLLTAIGLLMMRGRRAAPAPRDSSTADSSSVPTPPTE